MQPYFDPTIVTKRNLKIETEIEFTLIKSLFIDILERLLELLEKQLLKLPQMKIKKQKELLKIKT